MDLSNNSRPLLQQNNSDSEFVDDDYDESSSSPQHDKHRQQHPHSHDEPGASTTTDEETEHLVKNGLHAPADRYSFNYIAFYLMGIITLLPWNFFVTAEDVSQEN